MVANSIIFSTFIKSNSFNKKCVSDFDGSFCLFCNIPHPHTRTIRLHICHLFVYSMIVRTLLNRNLAFTCMIVFIIIYWIAMLTSCFMLHFCWKCDCSKDKATMKSTITNVPCQSYICSQFQKCLSYSFRWFLSLSPFFAISDSVFFFLLSFLTPYLLTHFHCNSVCASVETNGMNIMNFQ